MTITTTTLLLMYEIAQNNKIRNTRTSDHFASENEYNTTHADGAINTDSFGRRILIVDDDPDITLSFSMCLEDGGFEVYTYNDPQDALANFKPLVLLLNSNHHCSRDRLTFFFRSRY